MSHNNVEDILARRIRHNSASYGTVRYALTGSYSIAADGPTFHFLDNGNVDRTVYLPALMTMGGQQYLISNLGTVNDLNVVDNDGVAVVSMGPGDLGLFASSSQGWKYILGSAYGASLLAGFLAEPRVITGASFVVGASDFTIAINRVAPSTTAGTLPAVSARLGRPIRIVDYSTSVVDHTITLTPSGAETIMRQATWPLYSNASNLASMTLWPSVDLSGWYVTP